MLNFWGVEATNWRPQQAHGDLWVKIANLQMSPEVMSEADESVQRGSNGVVSNI